MRAGQNIRRHLRIRLAFLLLLTGIMLFSLTSCNDNDQEPTAPQPPELSHFQVGLEPVSLSFDGDSIWVINQGEDTMMKLRRDGGVLGIYQVPKHPVAITYGGGYIWVASSLDSIITQFTLTGQIVKRFDAEFEPSSLFWWEGYLWITNSSDGSVSRLSPLDEEFVVIQVGANPRQMAVSGNSLLVTCQGDSTLVTLDPNGQILETLLVFSGPSPTTASEGDEGPSALVVVEDTVWLAYPKANVLVSADRSGLRTGFFISMGEPLAIAFEAGSLWVADGVSGVVTQRDTAGSALVTFPVGGLPVAMVSDGTSLWVANRASATVTRIEP